MPNWCQNNVYITHDDQDKLDRMVDAYKRGELMKEFLPCPEEYYKNDQWYDWCVNHWGTKWDVGGEDDHYEYDQGRPLFLCFDSAWSPPLAFFDYLVNEEGFDIRAFYHEPNNQFAGCWENGVDDYYEGWGDSNGAESVLPDYIDEEFDIVNSQAMWEECDA